MDPHHLVVEIGKLRPTLLRGLRLLLETVVVPTMLLYVCTNTIGSVWGLIAVLAWCAFTVGVRYVTGNRVPATLLLAVGMIVGRTTIALAFSSVYVYLFQPIVGSLFMAALFLGSAAFGRPVTMRLAQDFVSLPAKMFQDKRVRRMFTEVALLWGASRLIDAGMGFGMLHFGGLDAGLLSRGTLSVLLTIVTVGICTYWGWNKLSRMPGVTFRMA
ncbi:MAG: hypothetical protein ICV72_00615 [Aldersonia sp.]|nr:hypothetical protein [Aldersonia sp.]